MADLVTSRAELPPRSAAQLAIGAEGARALYEAGAVHVWICGSLAHGRHWDEASDLDYATLGITEARRGHIASALSAQFGRNVDVIALEDAPGYVRVQITQAMVPIDRFGRTPPMAYGLLNPPATTLSRRPLPRRLHAQRHATTAAALARQGARNILDVGCGTGELIAAIIVASEPGDGEPVRVTGIDRDPAVIVAADIHLRRVLTPEQQQRTELRRLDLGRLEAVWRHQDALVAVELVEHLSDSELRIFGELVFEGLRPATVFVTTPNADFNALLPGRGLRDRDHRFEWRRDQFGKWAGDMAGRGGYALSVGGIGEPHSDYGAPTQFAEFRRAA